MLCRENFFLFFFFPPSPEQTPASSPWAQLLACSRPPARSRGSRLSPGQRNTATHKIHPRCSGEPTAPAACVGSLLRVGNPAAFPGDQFRRVFSISPGMRMLICTASSDPNQSWRMTDFGSFSRTDHIYHSLSNHILLNMEGADTRACPSSEGAGRNQEGIPCAC